MLTEYHYIPNLIIGFFKKKTDGKVFFVSGRPLSTVVLYLTAFQSAEKIICIIHLFLTKKNKTYHSSSKENFTTSNSAEFGCKLWQNIEYIALRSLQICILWQKLPHFWIQIRFARFTSNKLLSSKKIQNYINFDYP